MSVYLVKGKGWRYDFNLKGTRYTGTWFETKTKAKQAEAERREELLNPKKEPAVETPIDMAFFDLLQRRLDHVQSYNSKSHYRDVRYHCRRWLQEWNGLLCSQITTDMVESYLRQRLEGSAVVANKELQYLRAAFNFGMKKNLIQGNPTAGVNFFPLVKRKKRVPPKEDILKVISAGDPEAQQYLWTIVLTAGRVGEINNLTWDDIDFEGRRITLWTRKRKGGHREPREVPMTEKLHAMLRSRLDQRQPEMPWVFWHTYWSQKEGRWVSGPFGDRKNLMSSLCTAAKVTYFRFHALRHLTASILDDQGVPIGVIQRILGHQNRRTTEIYLHSIGEAEREAMNKLESIPLFEAASNPDRSAPTNMPIAFWNRKVKRPGYDVLKHDIERVGYSGTGRKYGVSDNAVRKWLRIYERRHHDRAATEPTQAVRTT